MKKKTQTTYLACALLLGMLSFSAATAAETTAEDSKKEEFVRVDSKVTLKATEFKFEPDHLEVPVDTGIEITLKNEGIVAHNLLIVKNGEDKENPKLASVQKDKKGKITVKFSETGKYTFYCDVAGHKQAGMTGVIRVVEK